MLSRAMKLGYLVGFGVGSGLNCWYYRQLKGSQMLTTPEKVGLVSAGLVWPISTPVLFGRVSEKNEKDPLRQFNDDLSDFESYLRKKVFSLSTSDKMKPVTKDCTKPTIKDEK